MRRAYGVYVTEKESGSEWIKFIVDQAGYNDEDPEFTVLGRPTRGKEQRVELKVSRVLLSGTTKS